MAAREWSVSRAKEAMGYITIYFQVHNEKKECKTGIFAHNIHMVRPAN